MIQRWADNGRSEYQSMFCEVSKRVLSKERQLTERANQRNYR